MNIAVCEAAGLLGVSERRVRKLLSEGRMVGWKDSQSVWRVLYPLSIRPGKRGPDLHRYPTRIPAAVSSAIKPSKKSIVTEQ